MTSDLEPLLGDDSSDGGDATVDACDLINALEENPRFHRDGFWGGIFHVGRVSYREISSTESLHVLFRGNRVSAHVDDVSPLVVRADGSCRYAWGRVLAHNLLVMMGDMARRVRGVQGHQRCNLRCEAEVINDGEAEAR